MRIEGIEIIAEEGKYVHRKGSDTYFTRGTILHEETLDSFEEVDVLPIEKSTLNYDEEVNNLIRQKYTISQEFAILRQKEKKLDEFKIYDEYCENCKKEIKLKMNI